MAATKLNLGCGDDYRDGWLNVDIDPSVSPDEVADLEVTPWEWAGTDQFVVVLVDNVLEHIEPATRPAVLAECRRVLRNDGRLVCRLPTDGRWDVTHYEVPSYRWPHHPDHGADWSVASVTPSKIGIGRVLPDRLALVCERWNLVRATDEIEVVVT